LPHSADAIVPIFYGTSVVAEVALYLGVRELFIEHGFFHGFCLPFAGDLIKEMALTTISGYCNNPGVSRRALLFIVDVAFLSWYINNN